MSSVDAGQSDRRSFLRRACLTGLCACGAAATAAAATAVSDGEPTETKPPEPVAKKWVATLLPLLASGDPEAARTLLRACSAAHYDELGMTAIAGRYHGNLEGFLGFLRAEWGWVIDHQPDARLVLIDENKSACVCPVVPREHGGRLGLMCHCSEGFAERLFSEVVGGPVRAEVTASILRGDPTCKYRIDLAPRAHA